MRGNVQKLLGIFLIANLLVGCSHTPIGKLLELNWYVPSTEANGFVPVDGDIINFSSTNIEQLRCLDMRGIKDLKEALRRK